MNRITALKVRTRGRKLAFIQGHDWSLTIFFAKLELYSKKIQLSIELKKYSEKKTCGFILSIDQFVKNFNLKY